MTYVSGLYIQFLNNNLFKWNSVGLFMENEGKETGLEKIARHITNPKSKWARGGWFIPAVYVGGAAREKYQAPFARAIGARPHNLTILNAAIFGIGGALFYYFGGQEASKIADEVAKNLSKPTEVVADIYAGYTLLHSLFRIGYAAKTKKAIGSPCPMGLISTASCASAEAGMETWDKIKNSNGVRS